ncbi:lipopolysaccharide heptosyltransferase I [Paraburkholderia sp. GAS334]|uniref:lipopolysaccharide heptosyltransferase I n=1 Tax=Paraburkholderia sp. GAS334 TaxID=3035131 RepID=UPI003D1BB86A
MKRILIVKVTSLGDIIEAQPVVADIKRAFPGIKVDWAADEMFADVARWNTGLDRVLCAPLRRFKKARSLADFRSIAASIAELRAERYDVVIDIHGVYKSAIIAFLTRSSRRLGYRSHDLGERGAAFAYTGRLAPRLAGNAWHGMRVSVSEALGYPLEGPPVFNLRVPSGSTLPPAGVAPLAMLFHATSKDDKKLPATHWAAIAREVISRGYEVALPWGSAAERIEASEIAALVPEASLLPPLGVTEIAQMIDRAALVVGVDTGFVHLAHALQKRTIMIFVATSPELFGIESPFRSITIGDGRSVPPVEEVLRAIEYVHTEPGAAAAGDASVATA